MRICDDRYHHERLRMELALRFLRHEARTQTIRAWTGLSDDRIRKLYRSYLDHARRYLPRHRGKSPHQISYFSRSLRLQDETAALASVLSLVGVLTPVAADATRAQAHAPLRVATSDCASAPAQAARPGTVGGALPGLARGQLLCLAFEVFRALLPTGQISFEHAVFLANTLSSAEQLRLGECGECGALMVTERLALRANRCHHCRGNARADNGS